MFFLARKPEGNEGDKGEREKNWASNKNLKKRKEKEVNQFQSKNLMFQLNHSSGNLRIYYDFAFPVEVFEFVYSDIKLLLFFSMDKMEN